MIEKGYTIPVLDHGFVRLIDWMGTDQLICEAARISYKSPSKGIEQDTKLLKYLFKNKHSSPWEMVKIVFNIKMPIFTMRQYVRHRMQNLNEVSARYTELPGEFFTPAEWRVQSKTNKQGSEIGEINDPDFCFGMLESTYNTCYETYEELLKRGVAKEMARIVLPVGIYTEIYSCWDMNNLLKFFTLRDDAHAQQEIQEFSKAMKEITREIFPITMKIYDERNQ